MHLWCFVLACKKPGYWTRRAVLIIASEAEGYADPHTKTHRHKKKQVLLVVVLWFHPVGCLSQMRDTTNCPVAFFLHFARSIAFFLHFARPIAFFLHFAGHIAFFLHCVCHIAIFLHFAHSIVFFYTLPVTLLFFLHFVCHIAFFLQFGGCFVFFLQSPVPIAFFLQREDWARVFQRESSVTNSPTWVWQSTKLGKRMASNDGFTRRIPKNATRDVAEHAGAKKKAMETNVFFPLHFFCNLKLKV